MPFIIAVDYDDTLFTESFPEKGNPNQGVIDKVIEFQECGAEIVLWTCRENNYLKEALEHCKDHGIMLSAANDKAPSMSAESDFGNSKIYANIYVDDRAPGSIDFFLNINAKETCRNF
tara:strand:+ start:14819 stop:15172 length:354 start_codon:yes stop_codon:yes gene_type:complete